MMKVFVVGATGGIDRLVVEKALKADHTLRAHVRDKARLPNPFSDQSLPVNDLVLTPLDCLSWKSL